MNQESVIQKTSVLGYKQKFVDIGPSEQPLVWRHTQQEAFDSYVKGQRIISVDTVLKNKTNNLKSCRLMMLKV